MVFPRRSEEEGEAGRLSPPSWYVYVLIASVAGGGGGLLGTFADPIKTDPHARPDAYTASMASADFAARDYRIAQLERAADKSNERCERLLEQLTQVSAQVWRNEAENRRQNAGTPGGAP